MKELSYHADFCLADQRKQRHNNKKQKKHQPTCLDDFNKKITHPITPLERYDQDNFIFA